MFDVLYKFSKVEPLKNSRRYQEKSIYIISEIHYLFTVVILRYYNIKGKEAIYFDSNECFKVYLIYLNLASIYGKIMDSKVLIYLWKHSA